MIRHIAPAPADQTASDPTQELRAKDPPPAIAERLDDDVLLDEAVAAAQQDARRRLLLLGRPVVVAARDGRPAEVWPSDAEAGALMSSDG